jgi:hypothetical protein
MDRSSPLPTALAGGLGAMGGRLLLNGAWPASAGDWVGLGALGVAVAVGVYVVLRYLARRRQP